MLKSLTTTAVSSTAPGSAIDSREDVVERFQSQLDQLKLKIFKINPVSSKATGGATDSREDVVERFQSQLDQLKLNIFKISQVSYGSLQGLVDSGTTYPLRPRNLGGASLKMHHLVLLDECKLEPCIQGFHSSDIGGVHPFDNATNCKFFHVGNLVRSNRIWI